MRAAQPSCSEVVVFSETAALSALGAEGTSTAAVLPELVVKVAWEGAASEEDVPSGLASAAPAAASYSPHGSR